MVTLTMFIYFCLGERCAHYLESIGETLVLIGGHKKVWNHGNFCYEQGSGLYVFNTKELTWESIAHIIGEKDLGKGPKT